MKPITFDRICYRIDGNPIYLNSGEFHYFRVPRRDWRKRMELFKQAGGNCLTTYIPWALHEPEEGAFIFGAEDGITDLEGFLTTAREASLYVIARPGPYQYSELLYGGLPAWLIHDYPELLARNLDGSVLGLPSISYTHPLFLQKAYAWFAEVCPRIAQHTLSHGGPVLYTQFDNELTGIHIWFGGLDYNPKAMGLGLPEGRYARFLRERYGAIEQLNLLYDAAYTDFAEVHPLPSAGASRPSDVRRRRDYFDMYLASTADYAATLCRWMREFGIDTPFIHNAANPEMNPYFLETAQALDPDFLLGSDHYYNLDQHWPQNNPTPQYARRVLLSMEVLRLMGYPPTVLELPGGSASDWPPVTAEDALTCYLTNLAYGMRGHNYYIFTGGPNPPGLGETTDSYDYGAAIGARGEVRPLYHAQKAYADVIASYPWLLEAERATDCRLALDLEMARSERYCRGGDPFAVSGPEAWRFMLDGMLTTALCASYAPTGVSLDAEDWIADSITPLLVVAGTSMGRAKQERLVRYLEGGGRALITPLLPTLDENLQPCSRLADFLGAPTFRQAGRSSVRASIAGVSNVLYSQAFLTESLPESAVPLGHDERSRLPLAWELTTSGGGRAIVLGMTWSHSKHEHTAMLRALLRELGAESAVHCDNPNIWTALWQKGEHALLFILNLLTAPMSAAIQLRSLHGQTADLGVLTLPPMSVTLRDL